MVWLIKKEIKDGIIYYYYQIENKGKFGLLFVNSKTGENGWIELAEDDEADYDRWRQHAYHQIRQYIKENKFPEKDLVAWG